MRSPRVYRTEAMVLKGYSFGEADRILTLLTPHTGKLRAIAKGVRRTKSRMSGHVDLFMRSNLLLARGRQLDIITQAQTIESFAPLRDDLWRTSYGHYVAELLDSFAAEGQANEAGYQLATETFHRLSTAPALDLVVRAFEMRLLSIAGFRPQLYHCIQCGSPVQPERNRFSSRMGGILCPNCGEVDIAAPYIGASALKVLRNLQRNEGAVLGIRSLDESVRREVEQRLYEYVTYRLESRPRSLGFLERLRAERDS